jgi:glutamyl-tRNA reductase
MTGSATRTATGCLVTVGLSYRTTPLELREQMAIPYESWQRLTPNTPSILLATCNRVEAYAWACERPGRAAARLARALIQASGRGPDVLRPHLVTRTGAAALNHLLRVIAGLDSLVLGEEHIRGQVREAIRLARAHATLPAALEGVFSRALEAGKRVRGATWVGRHPSIAAVAVEVGLRAGGWDHAGLDGQSALVLGAGVMAKAAAQALRAAGARVTLLNRTPSHAAWLASRLGEDVAWGALDDLPRLLPSAAVVVGATASPQPVLSESTLRGALRDRTASLLVILDIALPRDVEPTVRTLPGVRLLDLDDLKRSCPADTTTDEIELRHAEALVQREAEDLSRSLKVRAVAPAIVSLRRHAEQVRALELRRAASRLKDLSPDEYAAVQALTEAIVNKLLHGPTVAIRDAAANPDRTRHSPTSISSILGLDRARHLRLRA